MLVLSLIPSRSHATCVATSAWCQALWSMLCPTEGLLALASALTMSGSTLILALFDGTCLVVCCMQIFDFGTAVVYPDPFSMRRVVDQDTSQHHPSAASHLAEQRPHNRRGRITERSSDSHSLEYRYGVPLAAATWALIDGGGCAAKIIAGRFRSVTGGGYYRQGRGLLVGVSIVK